MSNKLAQLAEDTFDNRLPPQGYVTNNSIQTDGFSGDRYIVTPDELVRFVENIIANSREALEENDLDDAVAVLETLWTR